MQQIIKSIRLRNFLSFEDCTIQLDPQTSLFIGINGAGKSNLLKAFRLLREGMAGKLKDYILNHLGGFDSIYFKGASTKRESGKENYINFSFLLDAKALNELSENLIEFSKDIIYGFRIYSSFGGYSLLEQIEDVEKELYLSYALHGYQYKKNAYLKEDFPVQNITKEVELVLPRVYGSAYLNVIKKALDSLEVYEHFDTTPTSRIRRPMLPTSDARLSPNGSNLPQILNTIKINNKTAYKNIVAGLQEVSPNMTGIDFNMIGGNIELMLEEKGFESSIHVSKISDGTLRYLCLLAILYNPNRGSFICIDEPEVGLHPDMIANIASAIHTASETSQVLISTHSDSLLNHFHIENLRVMEKTARNVSIVHSFTEEQFAGWYDEFSLGKMWKNGDFGGVRYGG